MYAMGLDPLLQRCHMSAMGSQITSPTTRVYVQQFVQFQERGERQSFALLAIYEGNPSVSNGFISQKASDEEFISM